MKTKAILVGLLISLSSYVKAQGDSSKFLFGFSGGMEINNILYKTTNETSNIQVDNGFGESIGLTGLIKVSKRIFFNPGLDLAFNSSVITIDNDKKFVYPVSLNVPLKCQVTINNKSNFRYLTLGVNFINPISSKYNAKRMNQLMRTSIGLFLGFAKLICVHDKKFMTEFGYEGGMNEVLNNKLANCFIHSIRLKFYLMK